MEPIAPLDEGGSDVIRISSIDVFPLRLPLKQNFRISQGTVGAVSAGAPHVYVRVAGDNGAEGWGEARPSPRWSYETPESVCSAVANYLRPALLGQRADDLAAVHRIMNRELAGSLHPGQPIAKAAVDTALHDLIARSYGLPVAALWQSGSAHPVRLSYLISTDSPEEAARKARQAVAAGYAGVDVKLGLSPARDLDIVAAVKHEAPNVFFRADANQAYSLTQAIRLAKGLERLGVDVLEQPLPASQLHAHAELRRKTSIPIALDESVWSPSGVLEALRIEACDTIVIKLTKMGGLRGAKLCGEIARESGLGLLGGGLTESKLGLLASAHLFRYLELTEPADLNGPMFLKDDAVEGEWPIRGGEVVLPEGPGLGCRISEDKLRKYAADAV